MIGFIFGSLNYVNSVSSDAIIRWQNKPKDVKEEKTIVMVFLIIFKSDYYKKFRNSSLSSLLQYKKISSKMGSTPMLRTNKTE